MIGAIALCNSGLLIAATQDGFALIDLEKENLIGIVDPEKHIEFNRFNDGKCDPAGRFWAGTMSVNDTPEAGCLYTLESDFSVSAKIRGVGCSNGIAWSPDQNLMYYIDTLTCQVVSFNFDIINGGLSNRRVIIEIPETDGYPDGMTIDSEGMLWIALWGGWRIARYNPLSGKMINNFSLPVAQISSCTFGGENLQDLYVTTAKTGLLPHEIEKQPLAGRLFVIKNSGFQGLNASKFND
jgi:sugar lactone lactonase YvrE